MSNEKITTQRQIDLIHDFSELTLLRAGGESEIRKLAAARREEARSKHDRQRRLLSDEFEAAHAALIATFKERWHSVLSEYETQGCALAEEEERYTETSRRNFAAAQESFQQELSRERERNRAALENAQRAFERSTEKCEQERAQSLEETETLLAAARKIVERRGDWPQEEVSLTSPPAGLDEREYRERAGAALTEARALLERIRNQPVARFLERGWLLVVFVAVLALLAYPAWIWLAPTSKLLAGAAVFAGSVVFVAILRYALLPFAERQTMRWVPAFRQAIGQARVELAAALAAALMRAEQDRDHAVAQQAAGDAAAERSFEKKCRAPSHRHAAEIQRAEAEFAERRRTIEVRHERLLNEIESTYPLKISELEERFSRHVLQLGESYRSRRNAANREEQAETRALTEHWLRGMAKFTNELEAMHHFCEASFPSWDQLAARLPERGNGAGSLAVLRVGRFQFDPRRAPRAELAAVGAELPQAGYELPAVLSTPECPSLLLQAEGAGREQAARCLQNVMLRLLTSFPPGKVRFTIIDPVGLGQNFSAFMHLADFDERLVTNRIWTEAAHLHQRLVDLTEHMEKVIQKYLRNEFASIQEYNEHAGEVAEPFQILVIANFPANFSEESTRRLVSIAHSGARCGVYTLISTDARLKLPKNFDLADLESHSATFVWNEQLGAFTWKRDELRPFQVTFEEPPAEEQFTNIVCAVGRQAKESARVEVPFESVMPGAAAWWTGDSRGGVEVPLGRAGAKKLQYLRLGKGTSQHVLIAGKTGSGKSTLLNALITNLAIHYSPDELEFYLVDFKKGVEFKAYAACRLPHARVIAVESEREFGLSVLERLDLELGRRGDLFRQHGVQNIDLYRRAVPSAVLPRILLIIDEFQEFFTSDDKISHDSSLLLDRLVRQGRAFGIHVLLGSQTLAGAYTLARSTIGQMAVRIALQCGESDAHLILSEDNTAARLLNRPGEAIYNDANGLLEGNHPFQIVWLPDDERERHLRRVSELAVERGLAPRAPIVFEGNVAADPSENVLLKGVLEGPRAESTRLAPRVWLGSAVAIKDPTGVVFRRQGGSNLLIAGQQAEMARGILANSLLALSAQSASSPGGFCIFDGTPAESEDAGFWHDLNDRLGLGAEIVAPWDAAAAVKQLAAEVERRLASRERNEPARFLVIENLARFRDLKKSEDFSFSESSASVEKEFSTILREGPAVGVHALVSCDSFGNLNRWLNRQSLRDIAWRVAFQMSAADSSNLLDSPAASRLGAHMALCHSEDEGRAEKFRPYGPPSADWLAWCAQRLRPVADTASSAGLG